jgi:hypothetical protein
MTTVLSTAPASRSVEVSPGFAVPVARLFEEITPKPAG